MFVQELILIDLPAVHIQYSISITAWFFHPLSLSYPPNTHTDRRTDMTMLYTHTHTHTHTQQEHAPYSISHMPKLQTPLLLQTTTQHPLPETWPSWTAGTRRDLGLSPPWGESREGEEERVRARPPASAPHCPPETAQLHSNPPPERW